MYVNDTSRPLIFLGTNSNLYKYTEICALNGIEVAGIIDSDYYGNIDEYNGVKVIAADSIFDDHLQLEFYKKTYNFFCAVNWTPMQDEISKRNRNKRIAYLKTIIDKELSCISIIGPISFVSPSAKIGKGCFIDNMVHIESKVNIGNFVNVYAKTHIGHHANVSDNCVLQRMSVVPSESLLEKDVYFAPMVKALKDGATFGTNTFIHEGVYIRRGTLSNEVVSLQSENLKRVVSGLDNCL
jgi:NDP-sugar pyrophosphorylase family protein